MHKITSGAIGLGAVTVLLAGPAVAAEEAPMTTGQARKVFLTAVCPLNESLVALSQAESAAEPQWSTIQPLIKKAADQEMRTAAKLGHPKRPWPADVRSHMPALVELDLSTAGSLYVLAAASSMQEYESLIHAMRGDLSPRVKAQEKAFSRSRPIIHKRLNLPAKDTCGQQ